MNILILGATGATGKHLLRQLIEKGHEVKAIVRSSERIPKDLRNSKHLSIIQAPLLDLTDKELESHTQGIDAIASCLGHNLTWKGIYGHPRKLVTGAVKRICKVIKTHNADGPVKYVLMSSSGVRNKDVESRSWGERIIIVLLRTLLPPHPDNEQAVEYLRTAVGQTDPFVEWSAVRPDNLIDEDEVSSYSIHASLTRSGIFDPGKTSRINVAHFMAKLITDDATWDQWKGKMPVIYNSD